MKHTAKHREDRDTFDLILEAAKEGNLMLMEDPPKGFGGGHAHGVLVVQSKTDHGPEFLPVARIVPYMEMRETFRLYQPEAIAILATTEPETREEIVCRKRTVTIKK